MNSAETARAETFAALLRCPDCTGTTELLEDRALCCVACGRRIELDGNLALALPRHLERGQIENRQHYDAMAEQEGNHLLLRSRTRNHRTKLRQIVEQLGLAQMPPGTVLEMGTAFGTHANGVLALGHRYIGVDLSAGLLRGARRRNPVLEQHPLIAGDGMALPLQDNVADAVYCVGTLHHLPDPGQGVAELLRVLRPGGRFCFIEPRRLYPTHFLHTLLLYKTEIGALKVSGARLHRWASQQGVAELKLTPFIFTPNRPSVLIPWYDRFDASLGARPSLGFLSVMIAVHGRK